MIAIINMHIKSLELARFHRNKDLYIENSKTEPDERIVEGLEEQIRDLDRELFAMKDKINQI